MQLGKKSVVITIWRVHEDTRNHTPTHTVHISDGGDGGDGGDGVQLALVRGECGGDGAAGDGQCRAPRQHVGQRAVPDGASGQHEPIKNLMKKIILKEQV